MDNVREWLDKGVISAERARRALPILVRQARAEQPITYKDLSIELGMDHHRPVKTPAGYIGYTLNAIGNTRGWKRRPPPPLQSLVVNKHSGFPGSGVDGFMSAAYREAQTQRQKTAALKGVHSQLYAYPHWEELLDYLELDPAPLTLDNILRKAINAKGRGGEGPEHRLLKDYIVKNPFIVGLPPAHASGSPEFGLPSGDRVDVVFVGNGLKTAVEVKSCISSEDDIARGLFQCLKYRVVLEAQAALSASPFDVCVFLVVGKKFPESLLPLKNSLGVSVIDRVVPSATTGGLRRQSA